MRFPPLRSVLITGASGYIGSALMWRLLRDGVQAPLRPCDVRDPVSVRRALQRFATPPDACIHLASALPRAGVSEELFHEVNAVGTQIVAEACRGAGVRAFVLASSASVFAGGAALDEAAPREPTTPYGASKVAAEDAIAQVASLGGMRAVTLRLFNVAGAAPSLLERPPAATLLIPLAIRAALRQSPPIRVNGTDYATPDGTCLRDYIHVEDAVSALIRCAEWAAAQQELPTYEVFHAGSGHGSSIRDVLAAVTSELGVDVPTIEGPARAGDAPILVSDPRKMQRVLGLTPSTDLRRMVRDYARQLGVPTV